MHGPSRCWPLASSQGMTLVASKGEETILRSEEHTSELQSPCNLVCRLLLEKKKKNDRCFCLIVTMTTYHSTQCVSNDHTRADTVNLLLTRHITCHHHLLPRAPFLFVR